MTAFATTSVHHIETTVNSELPADYRKYRSRHCEPEMQRTEKLYLDIDSIEGTERHKKLLDCRSSAWFARDVRTGQVKIMSNSCRLRWCPICSKARSAFLIMQVHEWLRKVRRPKFMTLTMKHTNADLEHQIKWLYKHFRQFRMRKIFRKKMHGGIWFFQLKRSKETNEWHPHLHCVIDAEYIPQDILSKEWKAQTGTSSIVDIRAVRSVQKVAEYVSRYCSRPAKLTDFNEKESIEIHRVFHGRRLCGTWGSGRKISLRPPKCEDKMQWERIGSWRAVITQRETLPRAKAVIRAFLTDSTIPRGIIIREEQTEIEKYSPDINLNFGLEDLHGNFEEFL
jgi:hypothetical protein